MKIVPQTKNVRKNFCAPVEVALEMIRRPPVTTISPDSS
jgi:hypothetical protein